MDQPLQPPFMQSYGSNPLYSQPTQQQHHQVPPPYMMPTIKQEGYFNNGGMGLPQYSLSNLSESSQPYIGIGGKTLNHFNNSTMSDPGDLDQFKMLLRVNSSNLPYPDTTRYSPTFHQNNDINTDVKLAGMLLQSVNLDNSSNLQPNLSNNMQINIAYAMKRKGTTGLQDSHTDKKQCLLQAGNSLMTKSLGNIPVMSNLSTLSDSEVKMFNAFAMSSSNPNSLSNWSQLHSLQQKHVPRINFAKVLNSHCFELSTEEIIASMRCIYEGGDVPGDSKIQGLKSIVCDNERRADRFHKKKSADLVFKSIKAIRNKAASMTSSGSGQGCTIVVVTKKQVKISKSPNSATFLQESKEPVTRSNFGKWINAFMKVEGIGGPY